MPNLVNSNRKSAINFIIFKRKWRQYVKVLASIIFFAILVCAVTLCFSYKKRIVNLYVKVVDKVSNIYTNLFETNIKKINIKLDSDTLLEESEIRYFFEKFLYTSVSKAQLQEVINDIIIQNPVIANVYVNRILATEELNVNIKEKKIIAVLFSDECFNSLQACKKQLITSDNIVIPYSKIKNENSILKVSGLLNSIFLPRVVDILKKKKIFDEIKYINVHASGRFDIILKNGLVVKLPYREWDKAIDRFFKLDLEYLLSKNPQKIEYVDIRLADKVFIGEKK